MDFSGLRPLSTTPFSGKTCIADYLTIAVELYEIKDVTKGR